MKSKFALICVIVFVAILTYTLNDSQEAKEQTLQERPNKTLEPEDDKQQLANKSMPERLVPKTKNVKDKQQTTEKQSLTPVQKQAEEMQGCDINIEDISPTQEQEVVEFLNQVLGWDFTHSRYNEYLDYDEDALLVLANSGDARAMFTLGINYRFYARFHSFHSPLIRADLPVDKPKKREKLDALVMEKSIHWFNQAAYHGIPTALMEQIHAYQFLIEAEKPDPLVPTEDVLKVHKAAVNDFIEEVHPDYKLVSFSVGNLYKLDQGQEDLYQERLAQLHQSWQEHRQALQKPIKIQIQKSPELARLLNQFFKCQQ